LETGPRNKLSVKPTHGCNNLLVFLQKTKHGGYVMKIVIVEDERDLAELLAFNLEKEGYQTVIALDGKTGLERVTSERPDLVILDLMLPDRDGWEITRIVRADPHLARLPIIMLTARVEDTDRIVGLELGADDYVPKPFNPRELVARVRAVLRRASSETAPPRVLEIGDLHLDLDRHVITRGGQPIDLTPTEFDLLKVFMEYPGHAFTRGELIEKGLGYTYDGLDRGVDSHIKNLRKKIEPDPASPAYIQTVYGVGYRLQG
jgi:two-component system, OmpR family, alkaline phosphatase synthesis response regulator PhoP